MYIEKASLEVGCAHAAVYISLGQEKEGEVTEHDISSEQSG